MARPTRLPRNGSIKLSLRDAPDAAALASRSPQPLAQRDLARTPASSPTTTSRIRGARREGGLGVFWRGAAAHRTLRLTRAARCWIRSSIAPRARAAVHGGAWRKEGTGAGDAV